MSDKPNNPIPIKNLFYMLCYAWDVLAIKDDITVGTDDYGDAYDLLARVFSFGIGKLIRSGFHRSYIEQSNELSSLRGRILVQQSVSQNTLQRKQLVCSFDEYSSNDIFNQILKYTIDSLLKNPEVNKGTKKELKKQSLFFAGIDAEPPNKKNRQKLVFNRNNITYKLLISISIMLYDNTTVNEETGKTVFKDFFRQEQMHKVYELFILHFYSSHLDKATYKVHAPKINWHLEDQANADIWGELFVVKDDLGDRRTDIVIENKQLGLQLIFDAKYYKNTFVSAYMNEADTRTRTSHLNQLRGYLLDSEFPGGKIGALLYPMVNNDLKTGQVSRIKGTPMLVKTINLNTDWKEIEADMLDFVSRLEKTYKILSSTQ